MKSTNIVLFASLIAVTGRWARHKKVDTSMIVGGIVLAVLITIMSDADEGFAEKFAYLILFAVVGTNAEDLLTALGVVTSGSTSATTPPDGTH